MAAVNVEGTWMERLARLQQSTVTAIDQVCDEIQNEKLVLPATLPSAQELLDKFGEQEQANVNGTVIQVGSSGIQSLFESLSMIIFQDMSRATELRVRTAVELLLHRGYYMEQCAAQKATFSQVMKNILDGEALESLDVYPTVRAAVNIVSLQVVLYHCRDGKSTPKTVLPRSSSRILSIGLLVATEQQNVTISPFEPAQEELCPADLRNAFRLLNDDLSCFIPELQEAMENSGCRILTDKDVYEPLDKSEGTIRVATFNADGLTLEEKLQKLRDLASANEIRVVAVQEHRRNKTRTGSNSIDEIFDTDLGVERHLIGAPAADGKGAKGGVALLSTGAACTDRKLIKLQHTEPARIFYATFQVGNNQSIRIICVYAPAENMTDTKEKQQERRKLMYEKMNECLTDNSICLILGDFNATLGKSTGLVTDDWGDDNKCTGYLKKFIEENSLHVINGHLGPTYRSSIEDERRIDWILCRDSGRKFVSVKDVQVLPKDSGQVKSDHMMVICELQIYRRDCWEKLMDNTTFSDDLTNELQTNEATNVDKLVSALNSVARNHEPGQVPGTRLNFEDFAEDAIAKAITNQGSRSFELAACTTVISPIGKLRPGLGVEYNEHVEKLYAQDQTDVSLKEAAYLLPSVPLPPFITGRMTGSITPEEVQSALSNMAPDEAAGCDGIPMRVLQLPDLLATVTRLLNSHCCLGDDKNAAPHPSWLISKHVFIGGQSASAHCVQLQCSLMKLLKTVLYCRLVLVLRDRLLPLQAAFSLPSTDAQNPIEDRDHTRFADAADLNNSASEKIAALHRVIQLCRNRKMSPTIVLVKFENAFASVRRSAIKLLLNRHKVPDVLVKAVMILYSDTKAFVQTACERSDKFPTSGLTQGDPLSQLLMALVIDHVLRCSFTSVEEQCLFDAETNLPCIAFGTEVALLCSSTTAASGVRDRLFKECRACGLDKLKFDYVLNGSIRAPPESMKFLGVAVANPLQVKQDCQTRAKNACTKLLKLFRNRPSVSEMEFFVQPIILHGLVEVVELVNSDDDKDALNDWYKNLLTETLGISMPDKFFKLADIVKKRREQLESGLSPSSPLSIVMQL